MGVPLYDQGFHPVAAGEVGGPETSILEARDQAMEQCRLSSRNRELTNYDREEFHRREFMSQNKIEKWDEVNGNMGNNGRLEAFLDSAGDNYAICSCAILKKHAWSAFHLCGCWNEWIWK